jgi:ATP-dependent DNA helicase RecG
MPQPRNSTDDAPVADAREVALSALEGVGPVRAARLAQLGLHTIHELCCTPPRRLEEWPATRSIADVLGAAAGRPSVIRGSVLRWSLARFGRRSTVRVRLRDESGEVDVLFFNQPWMRHRLEKDDVLEVLGRKVEARGAAFAATRLGSAESPLPRAGEWVATYPSAEGVSQSFLRELIERALERFGAALREDLSPERLAAHGLPPLGEAVRAVHRPTSREAYDRALRRVALEPLLAAQRKLLASRRARASSNAFAAAVDDARFSSLVASFPFTLTAGQRAIAAELRAELSRAQPMRRLLQGDVGSGKTVLGALACLVVAAAGAQAAFMAPTELLAEQHFAGLRERFAAAGVSCALLTGSTPERERRALLARLASGELGVCFGTHALISERVVFARLALAIVDEQQRFGVAQREQLFQKGGDVHGLLMTATPIPRSLALTLYGDLDVSVLREKPPGRAALTTKWVRDGERGFEAEIEERLERGEQLYWVVPRIRTEEGADDDAPEIVGAEQRFERIASRRWSRWGVELVHGELPSPERAARLERFRSGAARILVATTVIEVGVDVPAATAIVIEACERLGLAQLHQLRGRVGRGSAPSVCYLLGKASARRRLELLERSSDGFEIAEADLAQRGMGDLAGLRQAGENREGFEEDVLDLELILLARDLAAAEGTQDGPEGRLGAHSRGPVAGRVLS